MNILKRMLLETLVKRMMWKEATEAMTALVYSGLHKRLYRGYVQVY
jgi:hypothetical protein